MGEQENSLSNLDDLIFEKMGELIASRSSIWKWVSTEHTAGDTETRLNQYRILSEEIADIASKLGEHKRIAPDDAEKVDNLLSRFDILHNYEHDIQDCLNRDLDAKRKAASDAKFDYVKNVAFILSVPGLFVTGVKNGIGNGHINVNEAMVIGFAVSVPTVFHKSVKSFFSKVANAVCAVPTALLAVPASFDNDMRIYYVKEIIKKKTNSAHICLTAASKSINDNVNLTRARIKVGLGKMFGQRGPRP